MRDLASPAPDPRVVVTALNAASLEKTLRDINILPRWEHVIEGLRSVFDIGLSAPVPRTISFSNPVTWSVVTQYIIFDLILSVLQHQSPFFISSYITSEQDTGLYSRAFEPGELEGMIGPFCTSPLPEAQLCFLSSCERPFFSRQQLRHTFREFFHRLRRLSYRVRIFLCIPRSHSPLATWFHCCHLQYFVGLQSCTCTPCSAVPLLCTLGGEGVCQSRGVFRLPLKCSSLWAEAEAVEL